MKRFAFPALALVTLVAALPAWAESGKMGGHGAMMLETFDAMDADKDGKLTEAELSAFRAARFAAADADKNGLLSAEELASMHMSEVSERMAKRSAKMIEHLDANEDGQLSTEELAEMPMRKSPFERADADSDGAISKAELETMIEKHGSKGHGHGHGKGWWGQDSN